MSKCSQLRRVLSGLLLATLLWSYAPAAMAAPSAVANTPSADPDEEIVYTDNNGVIRVLDTRVTGSNPEVKWTSPDGNWRAIALGDVNNDGDQEIIAVGGGSNDGRLTIFDPVASNPPNPEQKINGIPWEILYQTSVPGSPQLVATGNFDPNVPGDEIMYLYELRDADKVHEDDFLRLVVLKADSPTPTGRGWQQHFTRDFSEVWERIAVGNLDGQGTDEFGLVAKDSNNMKVFKVDNGASRILEYGSSSRPPQAIAMGAWEGGAVDFLAWGREADPPLGSLYVQRWNSDGSFGDVLAETLLPNPDALFFAQINSNTDAELVVLRDVPSDSNSPRMIVRGRKQSDIPRELEQRLDSDNGYRIGNAGDIDGDGMDEIVLARDNRILVFYEPNVSAKTNNYDLSTNRRNLVVGDLDKNGFISGPQFAVSRSTVETVLEAGGLGKSEYITLTNETTAEAIPFVVTTVGNPSWLTVT
ncbi:MAG TPA: VCBS repeat-containing protein, partial [Caldilineaceae bacterium]|nr:VCBS repeat-containing protein [Caldilineaceae bacterium]